jgi:hypothetical protein
LHRLDVDTKDLGWGGKHRHTVRLVFAGIVTASVSNDQDRGVGMDLDVYKRVFAIDVVFGDQDGRRIKPLRGEGAARHDRERD